MVMDYPIRINKYLKEKGCCSRRQADRFVERGLVRVNGTPAELGQKVYEGDIVELVGAAAQHSDQFEYWIFNKPPGVVSVNPQRDEHGVHDIVNLPSDTAPVGRLDKNSRGLLFLTNDGRIVNRILNPKFEHEKEYIVNVNKPLTEYALRSLTEGVDIEGYITKPAVVKKQAERRFSIILTEGKKHQIRRMAAALGYEVEDLKRIRIMNITLGNLQEGSARRLKQHEKETLFERLGLRDLLEKS